MSFWCLESQHNLNLKFQYQGALCTNKINDKNIRKNRFSQ